MIRPHKFTFVLNLFFVVALLFCLMVPEVILYCTSHAKAGSWACLLLGRTGFSALCQKRLCRRLNWIHGWVREWFRTNYSSRGPSNHGACLQLPRSLAVEWVCTDVFWYLLEVGGVSNELLVLLEPFHLLGFLPLQRAEATLEVLEVEWFGILLFRCYWLELFLLVKHPIFHNASGSRTNFWHKVWGAPSKIVYFFFFPLIHFYQFWCADYHQFYYWCILISNLV